MSYLRNIVTGKCPSCGQGEVFVSNNPYNLGKMADMHKTCSHCHKNFEPEPGFYYGAMYVSYAMTAGVVIVLGLLLNSLNVGTWTMIGIISGVILLIAPLTFRYSRLVWLSWFIGTKV